MTECEGLLEHSTAMYTIYKNPIQLETLYIVQYLHSINITFAFDKTVVYYDKEDNMEDVLLMVKQLEPCNNSMRRIYL